MSRPTIYHNPRCSKSRATLALLEERGLDPEIVLYLEAPPTAAEIESLLERLDVDVRDILRDGESEYRELDLDDPDLTRKEIIAAIAEHPRLLQRPIVVLGDRAAIGRPPEAVLDILD